MEAMPAFAAGLIAGIALVLIVQAIRRPPSGVGTFGAPIEAPGSSSATGSGASRTRTSTKRMTARLEVGARSRTIRHERFQIRDDKTGTVLTIEDGATTIEAGGQVFHRLADVPEPLRSSLEAELHRMDQIDLPDLVRDELHRIVSSEVDPPG